MEWKYIFWCNNTYFRAAIHISEQQYIFQSTITYFGAELQISEEAVCTRWGHGEDDKLELYEDGEFGTRPGRARYGPGIDRYGPGDNWKKTIWPGRFHRLSFKSNGMGPLGLAGAVWQRHYVGITPNVSPTVPARSENGLLTLGHRWVRYVDVTKTLYNRFEDVLWTLTMRQWHAGNTLGKWRTIAVV